MTEFEPLPVITVRPPALFQWEQHDGGGCRCVCALYHPQRGVPAGIPSDSKRPLGCARNLAMSDEEVWLTTDEVADRLKIKRKTLAAWASVRKGPPFARMGRYRRYRLKELLDWEQERLDES